MQTRSTFVVSWPNYEFSRHSDRKATPENVEKFRTSIKQEHERQLGPLELADGPMAVSLRFYTPEDTRDVDTLAKDLIDALTAVVYRNDRQVVELHAFIWRWSSRPRIELAYEILAGDRLVQYKLEELKEFGLTRKDVEQLVKRSI